MDTEQIKIEQEKLSETIKVIKQILITEKEKLKKLEDNFIGEREDLWKMVAEREVHIKNIEYSEENPYFARIDFRDISSQTEQSIYIGKNGIIDDSKIVVVDWRAPISSLYYDSEIGECHFTAPEGEIYGTLKLKRQFDISSGVLNNYYDVDLVSNDDLLQKYLNNNNDQRLKSIVSTIQKEQNEVIRKKIHENLIIQGVAGSGKTTVALHRIAYLVYNYMKNIRQNQFLVIGPNPIFLKYIKSVLPELDVSGVTQCTFEQLVDVYVNEPINISDSDKKLSLSIAGKINNDIDKFKCSMKYKVMLEQFLSTFIDSLTQKPLTLGDFVVLNKEIITKNFKDTNSDYSLDLRIEQTIEKLNRFIVEHQDSIISRYNNYSFEIFKDIKSEEEKTIMRKKFAKDLENIKKGCRSILRKYFASSNTSTTKLYKLFISTINNYDLFNYNNLKELQANTLTNLKKQVFDFEDLAALLYIKKNIFPNRKFNNIRNVVVDEAQDLGEFDFWILKEILPSATFSIFGDLAQSIYDYRSINNWDQVNALMFNNNAQIINFNKSYRTTAEIMEVADGVAEYINLSPASLVVRKGNDVTFSQVDDNNIPNYIKEKIEEFKDKGYKTIAVISKTNLLSCYINDDLKEIGLNVPNITLNDNIVDQEFSICTISNQLAKGLEFDAVIINNASEEIYSSRSTLDMKLLYVALTRALHELDIIYTNNLTEPLARKIAMLKDREKRKV